MKFYRWRISLKTLKWILVLCSLFWILARILQISILHYSNGNDVTACAIGIALILALILSSTLFLLEETVDSIDGKKLRRIENIICIILMGLALMLYTILKILDIPLIE